MNLLETNRNIESLSRETEHIEKNQREILELKNTITKILKLTGWAFYKQIGDDKEKSKWIENRSLEIIQQ